MPYVERLNDPDAACAWLKRRLPPGQNGFTGYEAQGWETSVWILHAMYENPALPTDMTHDDVHRAGLASGEIEPLIIGDINFEERDGWVTGGSIGRAGWPGEGWTRLRWHDLAKRLGIRLHDSYYPTTQQFPYTSWPLSIEPPTEGSMDRDQFLRLIQHLAEASEHGGATECRCYYSPLTSEDMQTRVVYAGELHELVDLYESDDVTGSPTNFWPTDRSWLVYTDWDLCGTRVSGDERLINAIATDRTLEVRTP